MAEKNVMVSVIVPCYNVAEYLAETLDCIPAQSFTDWECIIVDDGSTDSTAQVAKDYQAKDSRFVYVYQDNKGLAGARNTGIKNSCGKYIIPLDGDDLIASSYIEKAVNILEHNLEVKVVYSLARFFGAKKKMWCLRDYSYRKLLLGNLIYCSCMYRRADYDSVGGYDENLPVYEDWDFLIRILHGNGSVERIPEVLFFYRSRKGSLTNSSDSSRRCLEAKKYIFKQNIDFYYEHFNLNPLELYQLGFSGSYKIVRFLLYPFSLLRRVWEFLLINFRNNGKKRQ